MSIVDFLREHNARVSYEDKWLVAEEEFIDGCGYCLPMFTVYQKKGQKAVVLYEGGYEEKAVAALMEAGEEVES